MAKRSAQPKTDATEFVATHRYARISPRKARVVVDLVRGQPVEKAMRDLSTCLRRGAPMVSKVLRSAIANATQGAGLKADQLVISTAKVDEGPTFKRWRPRSMGRAFPRMKRTCHIQIRVAEAAEAGGAGTRRSRKARAEEPAAPAAAADVAVAPAQEEEKE